MSTSYSKKFVTKVIVDEEKGETRKYRINKLAAREVSLEGFKIARAVFPAFGAAMDALSKGEEDIFSESNKFAEILFFMSENLTEEHFATLEDKLLGMIAVDGAEVEDWSEHFDEYPQDFLEILGFAGEENFRSFFMESTIVARLKERMIPIFQKLKGDLGNVQRTKEQDS